MSTFVFNEQKWLKIRVLLAAFVCLLGVGGGARAADPPDKPSSAARPAGGVVDREAFEHLRKDKENLLIRIRKLRDKNRELMTIKHKYEKFEEDKKSLLENIEGLMRELRALNEEIEEEKKRSGQVIGEMTQLRQLQRKMAEDKQRLEKLLAEAKSESGVDKLEGLIDSLESERESLNARLAEIRGNVAKLADETKKERAEFAARLEKNRAESEKEITGYRSRLVALQKSYAAEVKEKKALGLEMAHFPKKLADVTRKNDKIIKGAADRHYNTGVFYAKKGEYDRALAEFDEALKIDPNHAFAYYNLGHIYATYLVDREKAIYYFGEYLRVCPEAEDKDLVKRYIITWKPREKQVKRVRWNVLGRVLGK